MLIQSLVERHLVVTSALCASVRVETGCSRRAWVIDKGFVQHMPALAAQMGIFEMTLSAPRLAASDTWPCEWCCHIRFRGACTGPPCMHVLPWQPQMVCSQQARKDSCKDQGHAAHLHPHVHGEINMLR